MAAPPGTPLRDSERINLEKAVVLLVDDNAQALDILGQVLSGFGVRQTHRCASAFEAMEVLKNTRVDLVVTDANMPEMDGWKLVRWIRTEGGEANRFVPAIVCTGYTRQSQVFRARDCGANFVIAKPITPRVVLERIFWVAGDQRLPDFPNAPTVKELLPKYRAVDYQVVLAPKGTPAAIAEELAARSAAALEAEDVKRQFRERGSAVAPMGPAELLAFMTEDLAAIGAACKAAGILPE